MKRPTVVMHEDKVVHLRYHGKCMSFTPAKVSMTKHMISVGCTDVSPEVVAYLHKQYEKHFIDKPDNVIIQNGETLDGNCELK